MAIDTLTLPSGTHVTIFAPGFAVEPSSDTFKDAASSITDIPGEWFMALEMNGIAPEHFETIPIRLIAVETEHTMTVSRKGSLAPHVEIVAHPKPDHTLLLMVQRDDVVQWFLPANASRVVPRHAGMRTPLPSKAASEPLRFVVPAAVMQPLTPTSIDSAMKVRRRGFIARLLHIPLVRDLIDAPVRWIIAHIAKRIESKNKKEGFKFFDDAGTFPAVSLEQLESMATSGQPILFLTHGIFSSIGGAFRELRGSSTLAALRSKYGANIVGWDHWTVSKTPLENADEMLTRMAPSMDVDFICHSRGALVMRAALEHPDLRDKRRTRFRESGVGSAMFVAGANQGSQLASFEHVNTLLNVYSAINHFFGGIALEIVFAVLRVLAHGASTLPSVEALSSDTSNEFVRALNQQPPMSVRGKLVVAHANYDPTHGVLKQLGDLNIDTIFGTANDLVVPFAGAATFDPTVFADQERAFGTGTSTQGDVMHTNFFGHQDVRKLVEATFA